MKRILSLRQNRKGQGLVEYGLIIAGVALMSMVAISVFGNKVSDLIAASAAVLPGAQARNNGALISGSLLETQLNTDGQVVLNIQEILARSGTPRLGRNFGLENPTDFGALVLDVN